MQEANPKTKHQGGFYKSCLKNAVKINPESETIFEWPPRSKSKEYMAKGIYLIGFENDEYDGTGYCFNWILSNGDRSAQRDGERETKYDHMIPADALNKIRSVNITNANHIDGFQFFDKDGALLYKIGNTDRSNGYEEKVLL
jgi:hypothetical protein